MEGRALALNDLFEQLSVRLSILLLAILDDVICKGRVAGKWMTPVDDD